MAIKVRCPGCDASFSLSDEIRGKRVRCSNCQKVFTVEAGDRQAIQQSQPTAARAYRDDDDRDDRAAATKGRPASQRNSVENDYGGDAKPAPKSSNHTGVILAIVGGVLFVVMLVCGGGVFAVYYFVSTAATAVVQSVASTDAPKPDDSIRPGQNPPEPNKIEGMCNGMKFGQKEGTLFLVVDGKERQIKIGEYARYYDKFGSQIKDNMVRRLYHEDVVVVIEQVNGEDVVKEIRVK
jgi:predicted Zn finger-like uncharacterized protein